MKKQNISIITIKVNWVNFQFKPKSKEFLAMCSLQESYPQPKDTLKKAQQSNCRKINVRQIFLSIESCITISDILNVNRHTRNKEKIWPSIK